MPEPRVFISGYYGYANTGDEAILAVLLTALRARVPGVAIEVLSGRPEQTAAAHQVQAVLWSDPAAIARAVAAADLVITGGGGIFHDYGGFSEDGLLSEGNWGLGFHVTAGLLAALYQKPHMICAVGVGPLFSEQGRMYTRAVCEAAQAVTVRDDGSRQLLVRIGVAPEKVALTADLAFLLEPAPQNRAAEILAAEGIAGGGWPLAVVVRHWEHQVQGRVWEAELAAALDAVVERRPEARIVLIPFQQFPGQQEDDHAAAGRVRAAMNRRQAASIVAGRYTPAEKLALLAACRAVVAMRLHAVIFSLSAGVPFVALAYDDKVRQTVHRAGANACSIELDQLRRQTLLDSLELALNAPARAQPPRQLARENIDIAVNMLKRGRAAAAPVSGVPLALLAAAIECLIQSNAKWRAWLAGQKVNYECQISQQRVQAEQRELQLQHQLAEAGHRLDQSRQLCEQARLQLETSEAERRDIEERHRRFTAESKARDSAWEAFESDLQLRLAGYRSRRSWRVMLALRKAYVLLRRRGWTGRLRFLPWLAGLLIGRGAVETEQLEFPVPPRRPE